MSSFTGPSTPPTTPPTTGVFMNLDADTQLEVIFALFNLNDSFSSQLLEKAEEQAKMIQYIEVNGDQRQVYTDKNGAKFFYSGVKSPRKKYLTPYLDEKKVQRPSNASNKAKDQYDALINSQQVPQALDYDVPLNQALDYEVPLNQNVQVFVLIWSVFYPTDCVNPNTDQCCEQ